MDPALLESCSLTRHIHVWEQELADDPDRDFILQGIAQGFDIVEDMSTISVDIYCGHPLDIYWQCLSGQHMARK